MNKGGGRDRVESIRQNKLLDNASTSCPRCVVINSRSSCKNRRLLRRDRVDEGEKGKSEETGVKKLIGRGDEVKENGMGVKRCVIDARFRSSSMVISGGDHAFASRESLSRPSCMFLV